MNNCSIVHALELADLARQIAETHPTADRTALIVLADEVLRLRAEIARAMDESDAVGFRRGVMSAESEIERLRTALKGSLR